MPTNPPSYLADASDHGDKDRGAKVFAQACAGCHGPTGAGTPDQAGAINDPAFLALISDQALRRYVITGRPDLGMPSYNEKTQRDAGFQPMTSRDIADVVALLGHWRKSENVATATKTAARDVGHSSPGRSLQ
jgi:mono/diheme cytochrome c family protein